MPEELIDRPLIVQPGQLDAQYFVNEVLRQAALHCEGIIDLLPHLLDRGRISATTAQQADRLLTEAAALFREPLVAQGETVPQPIR